MDITGIILFGDPAEAGGGAVSGGGGGGLPGDEENALGGLAAFTLPILPPLHVLKNVLRVILHGTGSGDGQRNSIKGKRVLREIVS